MSVVLILGNGISRLLLADRIAIWAGEVWGCNRAYLEPAIGPRLLRLTGHPAVMAEALAYKLQRHYAPWEIWGPITGVNTVTPFTCPDKYRRDSGTTLVAQALHEGLDVAAAGFDLGGPDIHSPRHWTQTRTGWVKRWRRLGERYGWDRIEFWGHDHKPFLRSGEEPSAYQKRYVAGIPHIPGEEYRRLFAEQYGPATGHYEDGRRKE